MQFHQHFQNIIHEVFIISEEDKKEETKVEEVKGEESKVDENSGDNLVEEKKEDPAKKIRKEMRSKVSK